MSVALAANAPATFEIKSANLPLVALLLKSADLARLATEFAQRFGDMPDFFDQDPLVIDLSPLQAGEQADSLVDFVALNSLLRQYRLQPLAVRGGNEAQTAAALLAGLIQANDATVQRGSAAPAPAAAPVAEAPAAPAATVAGERSIELSFVTRSVAIAFFSV